MESNASIPFQVQWDSDLDSEIMEDSLYKINFNKFKIQEIFKLKKNCLENLSHSDSEGSVYLQPLQPQPFHYSSNSDSQSSIDEGGIQH
jgi:hypothetical protein